MINNNQQIHFRSNINPQDYSNKPNYDKSLDWLNNPKFEDDEDEQVNTTQNKNNKLRNALIGSLVALATISIPAIELTDKNNSIDKYNYSVPQKDNIETICNPELIAKGGRNDSLVETEEFLKLLNFAGMDNLPSSTQSAIRMTASANYEPVMVSDANAKEKLINQVEKVQKVIDTAIKQSLEKPHKTYAQEQLEYKAKYISSVDIIDQVDFSEISKYRQDLSYLKAQLRNYVDPIERADIKSNEKLKESINKAQNLVDNLTEQCKKYGQIVGNTDYNHTLSRFELIDLLNQESLEGLDKWTKKIIISKATENYNPINFDDIKDNDKIKEKNKIIGEEVQKAQDILDFEALKYKLSNLPQ